MQKTKRKNIKKQPRPSNMKMVNDCSVNISPIMLFRLPHERLQLDFTIRYNCCQVLFMF